LEQNKIVVATVSLFRIWLSGGYEAGLRLRILERRVLARAVRFAGSVT
jgi:hypothetical protein